MSRGSRLWRGLFPWVGRRAPGAQVDPATAPGADASDQDVPRRLVEASNTYVFKLAPIRNRLGERWSQYGASVHRLARRMLSAKLAGKASFRQYGDSYLVAFDRLKGTHAKAGGRKLYDEFIELLFRGKGGEDLFSPGRPQSEAESDDGARPGLLRRIYSWVRARLGLGGKVEDAPQSARDGPQDASASDDERAAAGGATVSNGGPAAPAMAVRRGHATRRPRPATRLSDGEDPGAPAQSRPKRKQDAVKLLREARAIEDAMAAELLRRAAGGGPANGQFPPPDLTFLYRSMWNLKSRYLTTYTSVPICWRGMDVCRGEGVIPWPRRPEDLFEMDLLSLEHAVEILDGFAERANSVLFMVGVHAPTLASEKTLRAYLEIAESIAEPARRNLIFELVDLGDFAHQLDAIRMVKTLSGYSRAVTASVGLDDRNFAFWKRCGLMGVGVDLSRDARVETEIVARLAAFAAQTKRNKLISYLREVDRRSLAVAAMSSGFDFLEGALIGSSDDPDKLVLSEFTLENLYTPEVVWA